MTDADVQAILVAVPDRIQARLDELKMTRYAVSKASGLGADTIRKVLHRENIPSIPTLLKLCDALSLPIEVLLRPVDK